MSKFLKDNKVALLVALGALAALYFFGVFDGASDEGNASAAGASTTIPAIEAGATPAITTPTEVEMAKPQTVDSTVSVTGTTGIVVPQVNEKPADVKGTNPTVPTENSDNPTATPTE
jgi:hypothetical protein